MKAFIFILFFLTCCSLATVAQIDTSQRIDAAEIKELVILTDEIYKIHIKSVTGDKIILTTHSGGEYYNNIYLEVQRSQNKMLLSSRFSERLQGGYDKLSAHKVFSMEVTLLVPHGLEIYLRSNLASVSASGTFREFKAELQEGSCTLEGFSGNAIVNTYRGNIKVKTSNARVKATSGTGEVMVNHNLNGSNRIELRSVTGDIKVEEN